MHRRNFMKQSAAAIGLTLMAQRTNGQPENKRRRTTATTIKIKLTSVFVEDQAKALRFYTEVLGFIKKEDIPLGKARWLTVVSPREPDGTELLLEPNDNAAAKTYQRAIFEQGIPLTAFAVEDIQKEYESLKKLGVVFKITPTKTETATIAVLDDTCGNLIQLYEV